jgi:hypothetical protein
VKGGPTYGIDEHTVSLDKWSDTASFARLLRLVRYDDLTCEPGIARRIAAVSGLSLFVCVLPMT